MSIVESSMVRVATGSRLHFGLFSMPSSARRNFGGAGLMIERPGVVATVRPAPAWTASGPCAERALALARQFLEVSGPCDLVGRLSRAVRTGPETRSTGAPA